MNQLSIDFSTAHARRSDPGTSHVAAARAERFSQTHAVRILCALQTHGPRTAHELSLLVGLTLVQIDRRLPDLAKSKKARVAQINGADLVRDGCRVWMATNEGCQ